jgi:hypothetical protein
MSHLYAKLGTHSRTEAVERARELGLLAPTHPDADSDWAAKADPSGSAWQARAALDPIGGLPGVREFPATTASQPLSCRSAAAHASAIRVRL